MRRVVSAIVVIAGIGFAAAGAHHAARAQGSAPAAKAPSAAAPSSGAVDVATEPYHEIVAGDPKAKVTVVEYASLTCPHCALFAVNSFPQLKKDYIDTGKIRYVFRDLPTSPQELAIAAAQVARCVPAERGLSMIEMMYKHQQEWMSQPEVTLRGYAQLAGLSSADFDACLKNKAIATGINNAVQTASTLYKVESTPTFFVGEQKIEGQEYEPLKKAIDKALAKQG